MLWRLFARWRQENFFKYMREEFALDALAARLKEAGYRIPQDLSLIGFDNLPASVHSAFKCAPLNPSARFAKSFKSTVILLISVETDTVVKKSPVPFVSQKYPPLMNI